MEDIGDKLHRLSRLAEEPVREPMTRSEQFPSMAAQHLRSKEYERELRAGLREAIALFEDLRSRVEFLESELG
jgi:hypothetical protein